ncbi:glucose-1-phosphate thymidylyltransferase [Saccharothrix sp. S26]|uniref:glucose-1-phosphate thymidylyltransferase n=1 Tax=Saccharothrix sp. S26 TaxID=2907215 RepID=UPI001F43784A|nr:glucose-1-phosphate thymidylyltransferase [Saccharothrix sp. S26]MCE7000780.1 glucose-1-phosphate thymidylyltransferase [Saccharothrix sp. S26]
MKALVLAGGKGTRLRPFTYSMAKQLVPVANTPVLAHCLENIRSIGVREVAVVVGGGEVEIQSVIGDGAQLGLEITYLVQESPLGLAHCVQIAGDFLGDDDFVMYLGDNVVADGIGDAAERFRAQRPDAQVLVAKVDDPRQYGVVEVDHDGRVHVLAEKPLHPRSDLAIVGVYFFTAAVHEAVADLRPSHRGELEITDALQWLVNRGRVVTASDYTGYWRDIGSADGLLDCNRVLLQRLTPGVRGRVDSTSTVRGEVVVEEGAVVTGSELVGPLVIGAGAVVNGSHIGPSTSVGPGCLVENSTITDSILLDGAQVHGARDLRRSLIGRWAKVGPGGDGAGRMIIGDHSLAQVIA